MIVKSPLMLSWYRCVMLTRSRSAYCLADNRFKNIGTKVLGTLTGTLKLTVHISSFASLSLPGRCSLSHTIGLHSHISHRSIRFTIYKNGSDLVAANVGMWWNSRMEEKARIQRTRLDNRVPLAYVHLGLLFGGGR